MTATYRIHKTPEHLVRIGTEPYAIDYFVGNEINWEYDRRAKHFHETEKKAREAGKRYLKKMKKDGFEI